MSHINDSIKNIVLATPSNSNVIKSKSNCCKKGCAKGTRV